MKKNNCDCVIARVFLHSEHDEKPIDLHTNRNDVLNFVEAKTRDLFVDAYKNIIIVKRVEQYTFCHFCGRMIDWQRVHDLIAQYGDLVPEQNSHERCGSCKQLFEVRDLMSTTKIVNVHECHECRCHGRVSEDDQAEIEAVRISRIYVTLYKAIQEAGIDRPPAEVIRDIAPELADQYGGIL